jgi:ribosomal protein L11 methyltransferase
MNYIECNFQIDPFDVITAEIILAVLADIGFESFVETETGLQAYIPEKIYNANLLENTIEQVVTQSKVTYNVNKIPKQNWNAVWESNFEPIYIEDEIAVVAPFHNIKKKFTYTIVIEPKMSFGTGHHETTSLVMSQMLEIDFKNKAVLDMGCGTGILAILASKMGSDDITAIDNDEWAYTNALENMERNKCNKTLILLGNAGSIPQKKFDIILANINRNILLNDIKTYTSHLRINGLLLLSGFYQEDLTIIDNECIKNSLSRLRINEKNKWISVLFLKSS